MPLVGQISLLPFTPPGDEWALCDGSPLNIVDYPALFTVIGTLYGGDGTTTFHLPDLRGRTMVGVSQDDGLGATGGLSKVALDSDSMPAHTHVFNTIRGTGDSNQAAGRQFAQPVENDGTTPINIYAPTSATTLVTLAKDSVQPSGAGAAHENMQPFLAVNVCIALTGVYPVRSNP